MWADSRAALDPLDLDTRERVLDVGCGTGKLTAVLAEETDGEVVGLDADPGLLAHAREVAPVVAGDATRLPFPDDSFDLVVCQALLINLPDPAAAVREFARVSRDAVAAVEPDNGLVTVESSVAAESDLAARAREAYLTGVDTDVALGADARDVFASAGLSDVQTRRYDHSRTVSPPYDQAALDAATRKASGASLASDEAELRRSLSDGEYDDLRAAWREMGRAVIEQMQAGEYRRTETVPFFVTVGRT
ncbi:class I SAM-dependent methyltransferase [Haloarchaeobius amylolyticus]|uniref:class I SAM-dependent methyltransferase n=1 Tax=Haloarchaeobius amylolyticus TaxID=1198296 RepID=UPI0026E554C6|nr:class I SAM-dependent methyltransferase [Haloarchaeobius amylolyticus]